MNDWGSEDDDSGFDRLDAAATSDDNLSTQSAEQWLGRAQTLEHIETAVMALPARQREAFLLRYWEELDVAETAAVMGCTEGSGKTHCSRAIQALSKILGDRGMKP